MNLEDERVAIPVPSFMPPLKLKPVISDRYITTWYRTSEAIRRAEVILIDRDMDTVCHNLCNTLQLSPNRYTTLTVQGCPARKYDNRITVVQADLSDIDFSPRLEDQS